MPGKLRAVVVGCGRIGSSYTAEARVPGIHSHAQAYAEHDGYELVALVDPDAGRREIAAKAWGVPVYADAAQACMEHTPDVVSVCTPDATHSEVATSILESAAPRVLFMEKPLALRSEDATELLALARKHGCSVVVNFPRRFSSAFRTVRDELASGELGRPILARILYGKGLLHNGAHAIDLLRFWLGEPVRASGTPAAPGPDGDPTYDAQLEFAGGTRVRLDAFDETQATVFEGDLLTTRARVRFTLGGHAWEISRVEESPIYAGYRNFVVTDRAMTDPRFHEPLAHSFRVALDEIAAHLATGARLTCTGEDGLAALTWGELIRRNE